MVEFLIMENKYDVIIIGGGPAAVSAGIYATRKKLKTLLIAQEWGGQIMKTGTIENYPGFGSITGPELADKFAAHLKQYEIDFREGAAARQISFPDEQTIEIKTDENIYQSRSLIVATGGVPRKLNIPGEREFSGKGVAYCSVCDAPLFKNKEVAVIGGGNSGLEAALDLLKYAAKIYILEIDKDLAGDPFLQDELKKDKKIKIITNAAVREIKGDNFVNKLIYQDQQSDEVKELSLQGVFVEIGWVANSFLVKDVVKLNERDEIKIDAHNRTSRQNIFAAGDVTDVPYKQLVIAAGEGAKAALSAYNYLLKNK